jgi:hypothetical protein
MEKSAQDATTEASLVTQPIRDDYGATDPVLLNAPCATNR